MAESKSLAMRNGLVDLIRGIQKDGEPAFTEVRGDPRGEFDGFPSVRVLPGDYTTDKSSYGQNDRGITFIVRTHLESTSEGTEFDEMYELTDLLLDALDEADFSNSLVLSGAGANTYILNATRGDWFDESTQAGVVLQCDINVQVRYTKDL